MTLALTINRAMLSYALVVLFTSAFSFAIFAFLLSKICKDLGQS